MKSENISNHIPVYKGSEIQKDGLPRPTCFIPNDLSLYQQVAPKELYLAPEKLIYRFISSRLVFFHDTAQTLFLNSANMILINTQFCVSPSQIAWLFNTELMNWLFKSIFETHKVLRSDLEKLPIFNGFFEKNIDMKEDNLLDYLNIYKDKYGTYRIKG